LRRRSVLRRGKSRSFGRPGADEFARATDGGLACGNAGTDKSGYTFFNPTPDSQLRGFAPDRPPKANSAYTAQ
jgi:hypothetical protein